MWNLFKRFKRSVNAFLNPFRFKAGDKVVLINDPKQTVYVVQHLVTDDNGMPEISRGPMRQLPPSLAYRVRCEEYNHHISDFRSDSLMLKSQTAVEQKITDITQEMNKLQTKIYFHTNEINVAEDHMERLKRELSYWKKEPEHVV